MAGFDVSCTPCIGQGWTLYDLGGRVVQTGRMDASNVLSVPAGLYLLTIPELDLQEKLRVGTGY